MVPECGARGLAFLPAHVRGPATSGCCDSPTLPGHVCHGHGPAYGIMIPWDIGKVQSGSGEEAGPLPETLDDQG